MDLRLPVVMAAVLTGCGGDGDAVAIATGWFEAVADRDVAAACEVMEPSAVRSLQAKFLPEVPEGAPCARVVSAYAGEFDERKAGRILDGGFETDEGAAGPDQVGVFPAAEPYDLEILLMREVSGEWRLVSVGVSPS